MMRIEVRPLRDDLPFGARVRGVDLAAAGDPHTRAQIGDLFERAGVVLFEDIEPSNALQVAISSIFGPLKEHPVADVSRVDRDTLPGVVQIHSPAGSGGVVELDGKRLSHWLPWHFDHCYNDELNLAGVLRAVEIVPDGGITGFADGIEMYRALPEDLRAAIEDRDILYTLNVQYENMRFGRPAGLSVVRPKPTAPGFEEQARSMPRALHPAVWTRLTGEKVLHISPWMAEAIAGAETNEGNALLEAVCQEINRLAATCSYHHQWRPSDMIVWDNRRILHSVSGHDPSLARTMYRTTIRGDYGYGRFEADRQGGKILSETMV